MADYLPPVVMQLTGDDDDLLRTLRAAQQHVKKFAADVGKTKATVTVDADLSRLRTAMQQVRSMKAPDVTVKVKADTAALTLMKAKARDADKALRDLRTSARDITVNATLNNRTGPGVTAVKKALADLRTKSAALNVTVNDKTGPGIASARKALDRLKTKSAVLDVTVRDKTGPGAARVRATVARLSALSPVRLDVTFNGQTAEITATAQAMRALKNDTQGTGRALTPLAVKAAAAAVALESLKDNAQQASRALRGLAANATAAALSLGELRARATSASNSLRTLTNRAGGADGRLDGLSGRTRTLRSDMDDLDGVLARVVAGLGGLRGRIGTVSTSSGRASGGMRGMLRAALMLSPALLPIAAAAVPVAANIAAVTGAIAAFGVAVVPQIMHMSEAVQAQGKYADAVRKSGVGSKAAATADNELQAALAKMPPAAREATAGFSALRDATNKWSNSLSSSTMPVFTKSFATLRGMLPGFTPLVKGAATQLDRLVTIAAGGVGSGAFDSMMNKFSAFSTGALKSMVDGIVHLSRTFDGFSGGAFQEFMDYARANGPIVGETLRNLGSATAHLLASMGDLGVSTLTLVNSFAKLVNSLPREFISTVLQTYMAFKLFSLAAAGVLAVGVALRKATRAVVAFRGAAVAAGGGIAGLRAAFLALSTAAKTAVIVVGLTALVMVLSKLSSIGKQAPPDVDKLTSSLARLGKSGKASGEAAKVFGDDLGGLYDKVRSLTDPSTADKVQQFLVGWTGFDSTPVKEAKENFNAIDDALANLVKGGKADLAAAAVERLKKAYSGKDKHAVKEFTKHLGDYKSAVADAAFEQQLIADSQGLFGQQALATSQALDAQKRSADGLRGAIQALNDVQRAGLGGMNAFEAAIDVAAEAAKKNAGSLRMVNGELDLNSPKAREAEAALRDLGAKTDEAAASARESGKSWGHVNGIYDKGRAKLIQYATQMGLSRAEAKRLADQILQTPNKTAKLKGDLEDLKAKLADAKARLRNAPLDKKGKIRGDISDLMRKIWDARRRLLGIDGTTATTYVRTIYASYNTSGRPGSGEGGRSKFASGGLIDGPGTETSDDVPIMASKNEFVVNARQTRKHLALLRAINEDRLRMQGFARGGRVSKSEREARSQARGDLTISHFGWMAGWRGSELRTALSKPADVGSLVGALNQWRGIIKKATHGGTERRLLHSLDVSGRALIKNAKLHDKVSDQLDKAKTKLADLRREWSEKKSSVAQSILGGASVLTSNGENARPVNAQDVLNQARDQMAKATQFAALIKQLKAKGLRGDLIDQIASAGVDGGYDTALALAGGSKGQIDEINKIRTATVSAANAAGTAVADAMYAAGIKSAEGIVKGLTAKEKAIEASMMRIAISMEKAIKKALGIKSPSTVFAEIGGYLPQGLAVGIDRSAKHAVIAAQGLAMSTAQAAAMDGPFTMRTRPAMRWTAGGGTVVHHHYHAHVTVEGSVVTERKLIDAIERGFLRKGMRQPTTWQNYKL